MVIICDLTWANVSDALQLMRVIVSLLSSGSISINTEFLWCGDMGEGGIRGAVCGVAVGEKGEFRPPKAPNAPLSVDGARILKLSVIHFD